MMGLGRMGNPRKYFVLAAFSALALSSCQAAEPAPDASAAAAEAPPVVSIRADRPAPEQTPPAEPAPEPEPSVAAIGPPAAAPTPSKRKPGVWRSIKTDRPYVALTFDDGPHPQNTPRLLDMLRERGVPATFYVVGRSVDTHPEIVRRMVREGHEVANHTWNHSYLTRLGAAGVKSQIEQTERAIRAATGVGSTNMRPPYGATNAALNRRMNEEFGMDVVLWSVDPQDWRHRNAGRVASFIIENTKPGDIILAHDIHVTTVDAMPRVLDALLAKGFRFVTVSELLAMDGKAAPQRTEVAEAAASGGVVVSAAEGGGAAGTE